MEIKVKFKNDEVKEIIMAHALKEFSFSTEKYDIKVEEGFGTFTVEISEKVQVTEQEIEEKGER